MTKEKKPLQNIYFVELSFLLLMGKKD